MAAWILLAAAMVAAVGVAYAQGFVLPVTFWKWRLNVVAVVAADGALGLVRAFVPSLFGGPLT